MTRAGYVTLSEAKGLSFQKRDFSPTAQNDKTRSAPIHWATTSQPGGWRCENITP